MVHRMPGPHYARSTRAVIAALVAAGVVTEGLARAGLSSSWVSDLPETALVGKPFFTAAMAGAYVLVMILQGAKRDRVVMTAVGVALELALVAHRLNDDIPNLPARSGVGLGAAALGFQVARAFTRDVERRRAALGVLLPGLILPAYVLVTDPLLHFTAAIHPAVDDLYYMIADASLGFEPWWLLSRGVEDGGAASQFFWLVYLSLPIALAAVYALARRAGHRSNVLLEFVVGGAIGYLFYHLSPVVGPVKLFAAGSPELDTLQLMDVPASPGDPRNCVPSLHTTWALLLYWHGRRLGSTARSITFAFAALTLVSTLTLAQHYFVDLVLAFPFAVAIRSLGSLGFLPAKRMVRLAATGLGSTLAGVVAIIFGAPILLESSPMVRAAISWPFCLVFVALAVRMLRTYEGLLAEEAGQAEDADQEAEAAASVADASEESDADRRVVVTVAIALTVSGFAGLIYEVIFAKQLALAFGSTARASVVVLATYMGGIAIGSWLGGRLGERTRRPLRVYASCELFIAVWCALTPTLFDWIQDLYVSMASGTDPGAPGLIVLQAGLGALVLLPPTVAMGLTFPVLMKQFVAEEGMGRSVALLYGANTLGAAAGSLLAGYVILSSFGVIASTRIAVLMNLGASLLGLRLATYLGQAGKDTTISTTSTTGADEASETTQADDTPAAQPKATDRRYLQVGLLALGVGGVITFVLEVLYVHLLAVVAGNSTYAFSLMLAAFLLGLSAGAAIARRVLRSDVDAAVGLFYSEAALAAAVLGGVFLWDEIPAYFATFSNWPPTMNFAAREVVRFIVCFAAMFPPAVCIGAVYPFAMDCVARASANPVRTIGRAAALNTVGNILGAIVGGFLLIPLIGSLRSVQLAAVLAFLLALAPISLIAGEARKRIIAPIGAVVVLFAIQPRSFDETSMSSGANVYFRALSHGSVIDTAESMDGGLTAVAESRGPAGRRVLTLLTNGKFQGDDSSERELRSQAGFALTPLLHTSRRGNAMVIGYGTGTTSRAVAEAGFEHLDIVELSGDIVELADRYFSSVNRSVSSQEKVDVHVTDGRNFLLVQDREYDLISMEVTSIWFAGAASLYNQEFYELASRRITDGGVLQQWIQLHRISPIDILSVLATVRTVFPHVYLYFVDRQGVIVACRTECAVRQENIDQMNGTDTLRDLVALYGGDVGALLEYRLLDPAHVDGLIDASQAFVDIAPQDLISNDDNLFLEYSTPRGNVNPYRASLERNLGFLVQSSKRLGLPPPTKRATIDGG
jgi:spermidine synthase